MRFGKAGMMKNLMKSMLIGAFITVLVGVSAGFGPGALSQLAGAQERPSGPALTQTLPSFSDPTTRHAKPDDGTLSGIRFVTTTDFPPFNYLGQDKRLKGFHIDLAQAACQELLIPCTIRSARWEELEGLLREKKADAILAGWGPHMLANLEADSESDSESGSGIAFSDVYLKLPARFLVPNESSLQNADPEGLSGMLIGVVAGSRHDQFLSDLFETVVIKRFKSIEAATSSLTDGDLDALFGDGTYLAFWMNSRGDDVCCRFLDGAFVEPGYFDAGLAIAVRSEDETLLNGLNYALQRLDEQGELYSIYLRFFPVSIY